MVRRKLPDLPTVPGPVVGELRRMRSTVRTMADGVSPYGPAYRALEAIRVAIDGYATVLTGDEQYFAHPGSTPNPGRLGSLDERLARERGEVAWVRADEP